VFGQRKTTSDGWLRPMHHTGGKRHGIRTSTCIFTSSSLITDSFSHADSISLRASHASSFEVRVLNNNASFSCLVFSFIGGDSKTLMVVQVAPVEKNVAETVCSLNFAQRVRTVELGQATKRTIKN